MSPSCHHLKVNLFFFLDSHISFYDPKTTLDFLITVNFQKTFKYLYLEWSVISEDFLSMGNSTKFHKFGELHCTTMIASRLKIGSIILKKKKKASFLQMFTKSAEHIFQSDGPILQHTVLKGTLLKCTVKIFQLLPHLRKVVTLC